MYTYILVIDNHLHFRIGEQKCHLISVTRFHYPRWRLNKITSVILLISEWKTWQTINSNGQVLRERPVKLNVSNQPPAVARPPYFPRGGAHIVSPLLRCYRRRTRIIIGGRQWLSIVSNGLCWVALYVFASFVLPQHCSTQLLYILVGCNFIT